MFPNWGNVQGGYAMYGQVDPNYQQQMLQWQQMNQMGGQQWGSYPQPAPPPLPVGGEAKPPEPPADEKPPLPPEPPPEGGDGKEKDMKPMSETEKQKLSQLQQQAAQWQQQQTWTQQQMQSWGVGTQQQAALQQQGNMQQQTGLQQQSSMQQHAGMQQQMSGATGNVQQKIEGILQEEREFNVQYQQWKKQYDDWREQNQNHPNKEQFQQYEQQWMMYQKQMDDKRTDIQRRKQMVMEEQNQASSVQSQTGGQQSQAGSQQGQSVGQQGQMGGQQGQFGGQQGRFGGQQAQFGGRFGGPCGSGPRGGMNQMSGPRGQQMNRGGRPDFRPRGPQNQFRPQMNQGPRGNFSGNYQGVNQEEDYEEKGMDLDDEFEEEGNALMNQMNQFPAQGQNTAGPRGPQSMGGNNRFGGQDQQNFGRGMVRGQRPPRGRGGRGFQRGGGPVPLMSMNLPMKQEGEGYQEEQGEEEQYGSSYERNPNNVPVGPGRGGPRFGFNRGQGDPRSRFQNAQQGFNNPNQGPRFGGRNMQNQGPRFGFPGNPQNSQREARQGQQGWLQKHLQGPEDGQPAGPEDGSGVKDRFSDQKDHIKSEDPTVSSEIEALKKQQETLNELKKLEQKDVGVNKDQGKTGNTESVTVKKEPESPQKPSEQKDSVKPTENQQNKPAEIPGLQSGQQAGQRMPGPNQQGPRGPGPNQGPRGPGPNQGPRGPGPNQGPRGLGPNQGPRGQGLNQGPRGPGPNQGPRGLGPNQGPRGPGPNQGPRGPGPNQGPRGPGPNQGPRGPGPNQGPRGPGPNQGPRGPGPNQSPSGPGPNQGPRGPGPNQGPRGPGPNQGPRGPGPNQGPRGPAPNQGPRGSGPNQGPRGPGPNQGPRGPGPITPEQQGQRGQFSNQQGPRVPGPNQQGPGGPSPNQQVPGDLTSTESRPNEGTLPPESNQLNTASEESNTKKEQEYPQEGDNSEIAESEWHAPWGPGWRGRGGRGRRPFRGRGGGVPREPYPPEQDEGRPVGEYPDRFGQGPPRHREGYYDRERGPHGGYEWYDRRDPYYDRHDPYYDRYDPYARRYDPYDRPPPPDPYDRRPPPPPEPYERRPYPDPYSRGYEYGRDYYNAYRPPPPVEDRPFQKPEVIDHAHKSTGDFLPREPETPYVAPQTVIDYAHGRSTEEKERPSSTVDRDRDRFRDLGSYGSPGHDRSVHEPRIEVVKVEDLLILPGRRTRPPQIVVILRGLPGSGKTYVGKLIKDKEVQHGGGAPRMLCLDDYFMTEVEKTEKDPETGKKVKKKVLEYEYEPELESSYRQNMFKSFKKTIDDGFFPFIIMDAVNERVKHFEEFWSYAKSKGFQVYIAEIEADLAACSKRNTHHRSLKDIEKIQKYWEETPRHYLRLDVRALLQEDSITEVEMEDTDSSNPSEKRRKTDSDEEEDLKISGVHIKKSKWEVGTEEELDKLDGLVHQKKRRPATPVSIDDFLGDYYSKPLVPGQKRVRWADVEERKEQLRRREIGFVVGQTQRDWERITDDTFADRQLNRTKYI